MTPPPAENFAARIFMGPALRAQPDRRLVDMVRDGYDAAFEEIVRRYRRPLDRFAAAIVGGRSEDVTQDAFSKALLALRGTEAEIELRPWLYRIVRNTALNDLRDRAPEAAELSEALPGGRSAAAEAEAREELTDLMERLRALPEPQRAALVMRELEGLSHEEIAAALGVSGGAARQAIYRARAALREGLGLLVPMPVMRALAEHSDAATGGAIAGGAGGAALGGLGGGAVKAGVATLLVAGAVGAGVAVDHRQGERPGPEPAEAAPLVERSGSNAGAAAGGGSGPSGSAEDSSGHGQGEDHGSDDRRGEGGEDRGGDLSGGDRSGSNSGSGHSGHSGHSGSGDRSENSGPGSVSSGRHSGDDDDGDDHSGSDSGGSDDDNSGSGSSGSGSSGSGDDGGSSGSGSGSGESGSGSSGGGDDGGSSGPGSGEVEPETEVPTVEEEPDGDSGSGSGSSGSGSDELDSHG
jgi:RNA polymerase sigma factor (sigma-70 family)